MMVFINKIGGKLVALFLVLICITANAGINKDLAHLKQVYPGFFELGSQDKLLIWNDGTQMPVQDTKARKSTQEKLDNPSLADQISKVYYPAGEINLPAYFLKNEDPGRIRYEPFALKMYGATEEAVRSHLVTITWMPGAFKNADGSARYSLPVTTINRVNEKLQHISTELEQLVLTHPDYKKYLANPGGTFQWRMIANTHRMSFHSFGMTIDINVDYSNYWQWDIYSLYLKPAENAIKPENIAGKAVVLVRNRAYFVEDHTLVMKDGVLFTIPISLTEEKQNQLLQLGITDGEIKRNNTTNGLINSIMEQALANGNRPLPENISFNYYPNQIPWPIILIFEKYGFIWGGKWHHYDTMHFEYRPELF